MKAPPLILICDHRRSGIEHQFAFLKEEGFRVEVSPSLRHSLRRIQEDNPGLILIDPLVQDGHVEISALDRARSGDPPIPLLVVAERSDSQATLRLDRTLARDAWDVIFRDAPGDEIRLRVQRMCQTSELLQEMVELRHQASHDDRTDLLRPQAFQKRLFEHFSAAQRHRLELALVLVDLDKFGSINKRFDHTVGDQLITRVGEVIRMTLRTEDVAGRLGGDEFGVLLPYTGKIDAAQVLRRLREEIVKLSGPPPGSSEVIQVSASIGFETFDGKDLESVETLRRHSERALRSAKRSGGDRVVYYRNLDEEAG